MESINNADHYWIPHMDYYCHSDEGLESRICKELLQFDKKTNPIFLIGEQFEQTLYKGRYTHTANKHKCSALLALGKCRFDPP